MSLSDPGAPAERTLLAWMRTCLALGATSMLLARLVIDRTPLALALGTTLATGAGILYLAADRRYHAQRHLTPATGLLRLVTSLAVVVSLSCALSVLAR